MHCDGCSARLQKVLSGKTGVQSAEVSFADNQALLEYDSEIISAEQLQDAVENAGFEIASA
jgi:copper chaperone CopZ